MILNLKIFIVDVFIIVLSFIVIGFNYQKAMAGNTNSQIIFSIFILSLILTIAHLIKAYLNTQKPDPSTKEDIEKTKNEVNEHTTESKKEIIKHFNKNIEAVLSKELNHPDTSIFLVPYPKNSFLKNGDIWTDKIKGMFTKEYQAVVCQAATVGQGGIGKTAMAIEYAHRYAADYPGGVFWLSMENGLLGATSAFLKMTDRQGLTHGEWIESDEQILVQLLLSQLQSDGLKLIILDNLETDKIPDEITGIKDSHQLVTTRNQAMAIQQVDMKLPEPDTAIDIFLGYAKQDRSKINEQDLGFVKKICLKVEYLPLALEILGSLSRGYHLEKMAKDLPKDLIQEERETCNKACTSVLASLNLAGQRFTRPNTRDALCSIAYLDPETVAPELLAEILDISENDIYKILADLADLSILKKTSNGYGIHRLIQQAIFFLDEDIKWGEAVLRHISLKVDEINKTGNYINGYELIPHILHIAQQVGKDQPEDEFPDARNIFKWSSYLKNAGKYYSAEPIARGCLMRAECSKEPDHSIVAAALNNLAGLYQSQGKYEQAEPLYTRALKIAETVLGPDHPNVATNLNNLAWLYSSQGKYKEAEPLYTRALKIIETVLGSGHPNVADTLNNLAALYRSQSKYEKAEPLFIRALKITEAFQGSDHPSVAITLNNLAELYRSQGKYEKAAPFYTKALKVMEAVLGPDHPSVATTLNNLAGLYKSQGKYEEAELLYTRALKIMEAVLGPDHPSVATTLNNLAGLYQSQGKYEQAEPLYTRALKIAETVLGPNHPSVATNLNDLAALYKSQDKYKQAEPLFTRALKISETVLGSDHPSVATNLANLAGLYESQGKHKQAELLFTKALKIFETILGPYHPSVATTLNNLAGLYKSQGKHKQAELLYKRAVSILETSLGPDHPNTKTVKNNYANLIKQ